MPVGKNLPFPLTPIWDPRKKTGSITVGNTPGTPVFKVLGYVQNDTFLSGIRHLAAYGNYVVCGARDIDAVTVVDCSTLTTPTITGSVADVIQIGAVDGIAISGTHAFVTRGTGDRITSISLATPATPSVVDSLSDGANLDGAAGLAISGSSAFVAAFNTGRISTIDIASPAALAYAGGVTHASLAGATDCVVIGSRLLVAARSADMITSVDISTPASPTYETDYLDGTVLDLVETVHVHDSNLWAWAPNYVSSWEIGGLFVVDALGNLNDADLDQCFNMGSLDGFLAVTGSGKVKLIDTSDPTAPVVAHSLTLPNGWLPFACTAVYGALAVSCTNPTGEDPLVICGFA